MDFYHVLNRGVEKRNIVMNDGDRMRFVRSLYIFNDSNPAPNAISQKSRRGSITRQRDLLIHIHAWCLMDNHYHLLLSPVDDNIEKLSLFLKKLNGGYAKYFNEKYERSGYLWQGKTKKIHITRDPHFTYIPYYIHLNPLDYTHKKWRQGTLTITDDYLEKLDEYRWSSYQDYTGLKNFSSILYKNELGQILKTKEHQHKEIHSIVTNLGRPTS